MRSGRNWVGIGLKSVLWRSGPKSEFVAKRCRSLPLVGRLSELEDAIPRMPYSASRDPKTRGFRPRFKEVIYA